MLGELLDRQVLALERDGVSCRTGRGERDERSYRELAFLQDFDHLGADGAGRSDHRHGVQFFVLHAVYSNSKIEVLASFNTLPLSNRAQGLLSDRTRSPTAATYSVVGTRRRRLAPDGVAHPLGS